MHITLYDGNDNIYATSLLKLLEKTTWDFKVIFATKRELVKKKIGAMPEVNLGFDNIGHIFTEIIGENLKSSIENCTNAEYKLKIIERILNSFQNYLKKNLGKNKINETRYNKIDRKSMTSAEFIDESKNNININENQQLSFDNVEYLSQLTEEQKKHSIFVTPPEHAKAMAKFALAAYSDNSKKIDFGDSAIGTGALFLALINEIEDINEKENKKYQINSAVGIDIDYNMSNDAFDRFKYRGLTVIYGDAISPNINLGKTRNLMIVNPPFTRNRKLSRDYKLQIHRLAEKQAGVKILGNADLYVYHLLIMDKWLSEDGIGVWLLPSTFLQSKYAEAVRNYLLNNVQLLSLHVYDEKEIQFEKTDVSTTIVVFKKRKPKPSAKILFSFGDTATNPKTKIILNKIIFKNLFLIGEIYYSTIIKSLTIIPIPAKYYLMKYLK